MFRRGILLKGLVLFIKDEEIQSLCRTLGESLTTDYADLKPLLICPLKGSIFFLNQLIKYLDFKLHIDLVSIVKVEGHCHIRRDVSLPVEGRHVLIIEEIVDTGKKTHFLKERLLLAGPASVKVVTLLNKNSRRVVPLQCDYTGREIDDRFVVGFGMDADELGRNYKDIYTFAQ